MSLNVTCLTFDCYGTLIDWELGIKAMLKMILGGKGICRSVDELYRVREDLEFDLIQSEYRSYREILSLSLKETFVHFRIPYSNRDGERLGESVPAWPVFPGTVPSLTRLGGRYKLGIISNIDRDLIARTKDRIGIRFDVTVTAQDARAYKPSIRPFQLALERLSVEPHQVLHVSAGFRYDIPPARQLGINTAWINRRRESAPVGFSADYEFSSLPDLAAWLE